MVASEAAGRIRRGSSDRRSAQSKLCAAKLEFLVCAGQSWVCANSRFARNISARESNMITQEDHRVRFDVGKLTDVIVNGRKVNGLNLYGSEPPQVDSVWQKIKEHGWKTNIQQRSQCTGKVDAYINADITKTACSNQSGTIAIVSGDADFEPSINFALEQDWKVEVYSWEHATSKDLSSRTDVKLVYLNEDLERIAFVERLFKFRADGRLHPNTRRVLLKMKSDALPENPSDAWCKEIEKVTRWPFQYYWLGIDDLVLVFRLSDPSGHLFDIYRFLKQVNERPLAGMEKAEYYDSRSDDEDFSDSDNAYNDEPMPGSSYTQKSLDRGYDEPICQFKFCCVQGVDCYDAHTEEEMKYFRENGGGHPNEKIDLCRFYARGKCNHKNSIYCNYAHGEKDAYCPNCDKKGHYEVNCTYVRRFRS